MARKKKRASYKKRVGKIMSVREGIRLVAKCVELVQTISRFTLDDEIDDDGKVFNFEGNDDEHDTLVNVVHEARKITGFRREMA